MNGTITMTGEEYDAIIARAEAAEERERVLREALREVYGWMKRYAPAYTDDSGWAAAELRILAALSAHKEGGE